MKKLFQTVAFGFLFTAASVGMTQADDKKPDDKKPDDKKPVGALLIEVNAEDLSKEFKKDADAAKKKYNPNPPQKGALGGAIVKLGGEVDTKDKDGVFLKTESGVKVYIKTKSLPEAGRFVATTTGKFSEYKEGKDKSKTVVVEADDVKYQRIIGGK